MGTLPPDDLLRCAGPACHAEVSPARYHACLLSLLHRACHAEGWRHSFCKGSSRQSLCRKGLRLSQVFEQFLAGDTLEECYAAVASVADRWLDLLDTQVLFRSQL